MARLALLILTQIARETAKALFPASRRLGGKGVLRGLVALAAADHTLKSSRLPREHVLTKLALTLTG